MKREEDEKDRLVAKTMSGLEGVLERELKACGAKETKILKRAVSFVGDKEVIYRANYCCRTAIAILKPIYHFKAENKEELYDKLYALKWDKYLNIESTFAIDSIVSGDLFSHSLYVSQLCKDALVDNFRDTYNVRPSVNRSQPDIRFTLRIVENECSVLIDSSGDSLYRRGYRVKHGEANLNEVLAAGMILLSGWHGECNFFDPMCGSGTLGIEAAMISQNIPAGFYREKYGFMNWKDFDAELWKKVKAEADAEISESEIEIFSSDIMSMAVDSAKRNAENARLHHDIQFDSIAFQHMEFPEKKGVIFLNPPYGERMPLEDVQNFYKSIGDTMKNRCKGYDVWIISSGKDSTKFIGLRPSSKYILFNGSIECTYAKFEIFEGKRKEFLSERNA